MQGPLTTALLCRPTDPALPPAPGWAGPPEPRCSSQAHTSSGIPESPKPETRLRPARRVCHPAPPAWVITGDFGLSSEAAPPRLCRPARCSLASSCSASSSKAASSARRSERERERETQGWGEAKQGVPKTRSRPTSPFPSRKGPPFSWHTRPLAVPGGMLGEGCSGKHVPTPPRCSSGPPVIGGE